jgi:hypothetical protein
MACARVQIEAIKLFQFLNTLQARLTEGALSIESMENDAFQKIAKSQIMVVSKGP